MVVISLNSNIAIITISLSPSLSLSYNTGGKCSHGGSQDDSTKDPAQGGINKDTPFPCFSPHHYLHKEAAELAVQATQHYLDEILTVVGFDKYRRLFDLYLGSALSISIDTTGKYIFGENFCSLSFLSPFECMFVSAKCVSFSYVYTRTGQSGGQAD